jgi:hypothetical protein
MVSKKIIESCSSDLAKESNTKKIYQKIAVSDSGGRFSSPVVSDSGERKREEKIGYESNLSFDFWVGGRMREREREDGLIYDIF